MSVSVTMPQLGESVTEGTVTRWLKSEGDQVQADEPLLEVSTDKVDTEIPAPATGVLRSIVVQQDETAPVGAELAVIGDGDDGGAPADSNGSQPTDQGTVAPEQEPAEEQEQQAQPQDDGQEQGGQQQEAQQERAPAEDQEPEPQSGGQQSGGQQSDGQSAQDEPGGRPPTQQSGDGTVVTMPALGESVTEGTITRWLKQVGDQVSADEPLLEVSTDKVDTEIPAPTSGTLLEIKAGEDETVPVGAQLAVIGSGEPAQSAPQQSEPEQSAPQQTAPQQSTPQQSAPQQSEPEQAPRQQAQQAPQQQAERPQQQQQTQQQQTQQPAPAKEQAASSAPQPRAAEEDGVGYVTPLVRKLASEYDIDLTSIQGTGVGGRVRKQDVMEAAERRKAEQAKQAEAAAEKEQAAAPRQAPAPAQSTGQRAGGKQEAAPKVEPSPLRGRTEKMSRMRAIIAKRMVESLQTSAQLTTVVEVDVTRIARLREATKDDFVARHGVKLSFLPFFALAAVEALRAHPKVNASIDVDAGAINYYDAEHLGIAVDTERGLMVPIIHNAGDLNLSGLARRIADLAERTRTNKVSPDELSGGTFTITNTGSRGALFDTPIIFQPQSAILGTGAVVKRAVVVEDPHLGEIIVPRSMVYLALSYDHRLVDGADAARFLAAVKERLEGGNFDSELGLG